MIRPLLRLIRARDQHVFLNPPGVPAMAEFLAPSGLVFGVALGLLVAWIASKEFVIRAAAVRRSTVYLILALTLAPAMLAFAISLLTPTRIFNERYIIGAFAGQAMLVGWGIGLIQPRVARSIILCSVLIISLGCFGYSRRFWPPHNGENWRDAMAAVRKAAGTSQIPVLIKSTFPESSKQNLDYTGKLPGWLLAPVVLYPSAGHVFPVSRAFDHASVSYLATSVAPAIDREGRFILVKLGPDDELNSWLSKRFCGYSARSLGNFDLVDAKLYERAPGSWKF
jgi:hypothetical protein